VSKASVRPAFPPHVVGLKLICTNPTVTSRVCATDPRDAGPNIYKRWILDSQRPVSKANVSLTFLPRVAGLADRMKFSFDGQGRNDVLVHVQLLGRVPQGQSDELRKVKNGNGIFLF